jgi:hypothetical protein
MRGHEVAAAALRRRQFPAEVELDDGVGNAVEMKEVITDSALVGVAGFGAAEVMGKATTDGPSLYICDGSVFVTPFASNLNMTIRAIAARTADQLIAAGRRHEI